MCGSGLRNEGTKGSEKSSTGKLQSENEFRTDLPVNSVMLPSTALLHSNPTPLRFRQKTTLRESFGEFLGKNHMTISYITGRNQTDVMLERYRYSMGRLKKTFCSSIQNHSPIFIQIISILLAVFNTGCTAHLVKCLL